MDRKRFTVVYHGGTRTTDLPYYTDEENACYFAQSESALLSNTVSLWQGVMMVAAYRDGEETDLSFEAFCATADKLA